MSESFAELFEQSYQQSNFKPGELITGEIVSITDDVVVVNAGLKSEGIIPISQFKDHEGNIAVNVGDDIEVVLESLENGFGETQLSREKAMRVKAWDILETAFEDQSIVKGVMTGKVKGGFTISIDSIRAFLPASLVDVRPVRDPSYLEGKELEFKVIRLTASVITLWYHAVPWWRPNFLLTAMSYWPTWKRGRPSPVSSRT